MQEYKIELHVTSVHDVRVKANSRDEARVIALLYYNDPHPPESVVWACVENENFEYCEIDGTEWGFENEDDTNDEQELIDVAAGFVTVKEG